jgi:uncharacterized protein YprB with RNaseH-like and TPR domain
VSPEVADRAAAVAALRERLARLRGGVGTGPPGELADGREPPPPHRSEPRHGPAAGQLGAGAREGGFEPETIASGVTWVRRVSVDLAPFLERAGAAGPVTGAQLLQLSLGGGGVHPVPWDASSAAVLDLETLGLRGSGVLAFLVGIGVPRGDRLDVDQVLLVDPAEERPLLLAALARLAGRRMLVTYNGRSFDLPALRARLVVNRLDPAALEAGMHCDMLAPVRRLFRDRLGPCTLGQAERLLLGLERQGEAPGAEAPGRYRAWLRGGGYGLLEGVVRHNELDLCSTMVLAARVASHLEGRLVRPVHPADRYRLAVHLDRSGLAEHVDELLRVTVDGGRDPWDRHAAHVLARRLCRRGGTDEEEALRLWDRLWRSRPTDLRAARALAVGLERRRRLAEALAVAERALATCGRLGGWRLAALRGAPPGGWTAEWERRCRRLRRRLAAQSPPPGPLVVGLESLAPPLFAN